MALTSHLTGLLVSGLGKALYGEDWTEDVLSVEDSVEDEEDITSSQDKVQVSVKCSSIYKIIIPIS